MMNYRRVLDSRGRGLLELGRLRSPPLPSRSGLAREGSMRPSAQSQNLLTAQLSRTHPLPPADSSSRSFFFYLIFVSKICTASPSRTTTQSMGSSHARRGSGSVENLERSHTPILTHSRGNAAKNRSYHPPPRPCLVPAESNFLPGTKTHARTPSLFARTSRASSTGSGPFVGGTTNRSFGNPSCFPRKAKTSGSSPMGE